MSNSLKISSYVLVIEVQHINVQVWIRCDLQPGTKAVGKSGFMAKLHRNSGLWIDDVRIHIWLNLVNLCV